MTSVRLTEHHNGTTVPATVGDEIVIRLPESPTTGYRWSIENLDAQMLSLKSDKFDAPPASFGIGAGGWRTWTLQTTAPGETRLRLKNWFNAYNPQQTSAEEDAQYFEVSIQIGRAGSDSLSLPSLPGGGG